MKAVLAILTLTMISGSISLACSESEGEKCVPSADIPVVSRPVKESLSYGKKGTVCSVAGVRIVFAITENSLDLKNVDTQKTESYVLSRYVINRAGNEEFSGENKDSNHVITVSQMESGIALNFEIQRGYNFMNSALDSRLCK